MTRAMVVPVVALLLAAGGMALAKQEMGQLNGTITDITGARVAGATITIEGNGAKHTVSTAEDGTYKVELPTGTYRIKVNSTGFCPARRAAFEVQRSTAATFDFTLVVCPIVNTIFTENGQYKGETDSYRTPFKEEIFTVRTTSSPLDLLIRYGERQANKNVVCYTGYSSGDKLLGVTASYNLLTINAKKVRFNPKTLRLEAEGSVVVDNGRQQAHAKRAIVEFKAGEPVIELTQ